MSFFKKNSVPFAIILCAMAAGAIYFNAQKTASIQLASPNGYEIGELVVLDASQSPGTLQWTIRPETKNFKIVGKTAYFSSSQSTEYTVFIAATAGGTLATKIISLYPGNKVQEEEPFPNIKLDPKYQKVAKLIDNGVLTTLDDAKSSIEQLGLTFPPNVKNLKELREWLRVESS